MSGVDLSRLSGVPAPTITRYRKGDRSPSGAELVALARALGTDAETLIGSDAIVPKAAPAPKKKPERESVTVRLRSARG